MTYSRKAGREMSKWTDLYKHLIDGATATRIPISGFFELTPRCNLQCRMCYVSSLPSDKTIKERELTTAQWVTIGEEARNAGLLLLTLTGGEIFIRRDFCEIYSAYSDMGFNLCLFTNGSLIDDKRVKWLGTRPPSKVSITIYGASPETYDRVTGHPEAFEKTIRAARMLIAEGIRVELKTTVIKENSDDFEAVAELAGDMGITIGLVNYVSPRREGCGTKPAEVRLTPEELLLYEERVVEYNNMLNRKRGKSASVVNSEDVMLDTDIERPYEGAFNKAAQQSAFKCISGKCAFWFTWDGRLTPCGLLDEPYSEPLKTGFVKAWEQLCGECGGIPGCDECAGCSCKAYCMTCPARLKTETGSFDKPASYLCELAKGRMERGIKY